jgi:hypothetical protein
VYCIEVSARILTYPQRCCCCTTSGALLKSFRAIATRTTGVRVVRTTNRWWDFPLCSACHGWIIQHQAAQVVKFLCVIVGVLLVGSLAGGFLLRPKPVSNWLLNLSPIFAFLLPFLFVLWRKREQEADTLKPADACSPEPVIYASWDGTIHTFFFPSELYSYLFRNANSAKVLERGGRMIDSRGWEDTDLH